MPTPHAPFPRPRRAPSSTKPARQLLCLALLTATLVACDRQPCAERAGDCVLPSQARYVAIPSGTDQDLSAISGSTFGPTYVVGGGGTILRSHDGGATWRPQRSGVEEELLAVWDAGGDEAFVAGRRGTLLHTTDGGKEWKRQDAGTRDPISGIWGDGVGGTYLAAHNGLFLSRDRGATWSRVHFHAAGFTALWGSGPRDVYAVGGHGNLAHFDGQAWSPLGSGTTVLLTAVGGVDADEVYLAGYGGLVLRSLDRGATWSAMSPPSDHGWNALAILGPGQPVVGGSGELRASSDGGATWARDLLADGAYATGLFGRSPGELFVVARGGTILRRDR